MAGAARFSGEGSNETARVHRLAACLISYSADTTYIFRRSATYVDRILKGGKTLQTFRRKRRPNSNWQSISRPRMRSVSPSHQPCLRLPTRLSNER